VHQHGRTFRVVGQDDRGTKLARAARYLITIPHRTPRPAGGDVTYRKACHAVALSTSATRSDSSPTRQKETGVSRGDASNRP
jgi:hypothetical protein